MNRHTRYSRIFFSTDSPAPGGGGGGGGSPAVLEGPITPAADFDPTNYEPPSNFDVASFIEGEGKNPDEPAPKPPAAKPAKEEPKKPDAKKPDEKPAVSDDPKKDPPAAQLRTRLKELETREADLTRQLEAANSDGRVKELTAKLDQTAALIKAKEAELEESNRKLVVHNPLVAKELKTLEENFNKEFNTVMEIVPHLKGSYQALVSKFAALQPGTPEYADQLREFRGELRETFDEDAGLVFDAVRKGRDFLNLHAETAKRVQADGQKILFQEQRKQWETEHSRVDKEFDNWLKPPADAESADPFNTRLFLQKFEGTMEQAEVERVNGAVKAYIRNVTAGAQPRTKDDFPGLSDEQIQRELGDIEQRVSADRSRLPEVLAVAMKAAAYQRPLIARLAQLQERLAKYEGSRPPDPTQGDGQVARGGNSGALDDLDLPSPDSIAASIR